MKLFGNWLSASRSGMPFALKQTLNMESDYYRLKNRFL